MASANTCTITGTICKADGSPYCEAQVLATVESTEDDQGGQLASGVGVVSNIIEAYTDDNGIFSITLIKGLKVTLEIPDINLRKSICVPDEDTEDFANLV